MSKRQRTTEDSDLANVLRQRQRHDPEQKQLQGQQTFALMMRAAAQQQHHQSQPPTAIPNLSQQQSPHETLKENQPQGQQVFTLMMRAAIHQHHQQQSSQRVPSNCFRCPSLLTSLYSCTYCEHSICQQCIQQCQSCNSMYCTACSVIDYSTATEQVYCLTCFTF